MLDEQLMPSTCASDIDLIHADKGKIVTIGNYARGSKQKSSDEMCLFSKYADNPLLSTRVEIPSMAGVDHVSLTHHGLPIRIHPWLAMGGLLYSLTAQKGTRFDVGFSGSASCNFVEADPSYPIKRPTARKPTAKTEPAEQRVISCNGNVNAGEIPSKDNMVQKERVAGKKGSVLSSFIDAGKFNEDNQTRFSFKDEGTITLRPQYFTEQWFMIRSGGQLKTRGLHGDRKQENWFAAKWKRLNREINFLFDGGERTSFVDFAGNITYGDVSNGEMINDREIGKEPDTHVVHMAFIDPAVIKNVAIDMPRYGNGESMTIAVKPGTTCEMRTNFKHRPAIIMDNILFCSKLDNRDSTFNKRAQKFISDFDLAKREQKNDKKKE